MRLLSEVAGKRIYLGSDEETWYEVRAELHMQSRVLSSEAYALLGLRWAAEEETARDLEKWFKRGGEGRALGAEPFGEVYTGWEALRVEWTEGMLDEEGQSVAPFEPFYVYRCWAEQGYWPPAPVDPDPDPDEGKPAPRRSDFKGDRFA